MSLRQRIATLAWLGFALALAGQDLRELSFMTAMPARPPPVIDGRLADPCWQSAVPNRNYYEFLKPSQTVNTPGRNAPSSTTTPASPSAWSTTTTRSAS